MAKKCSHSKILFPYKMVTFSVCARKSLDESAQTCVCVCVISVELSNADVMRDLFKQRVMAGFMDRAAKARTPHATIHVAFVCPHI